MLYAREPVYAMYTGGVQKVGMLCIRTKWITPNMMQRSWLFFSKDQILINRINITSIARLLSTITEPKMVFHEQYVHIPSSLTYVNSTILLSHQQSKPTQITPTPLLINMIFYQLASTNFHSAGVKGFLGRVTECILQKTVRGLRNHRKHILPQMSTSHDSTILPQMSTWHDSTSYLLTRDCDIAFHSRGKYCSQASQKTHIPGHWWGGGGFVGFLRRNRADPEVLHLVPLDQRFLTFYSNFPTLATTKLLFPPFPSPTYLKMAIWWHHWHRFISITASLLLKGIVFEWLKFIRQK